MTAQFTPGPWGGFCFDVPDITKREPSSATAWPNRKALAGANRIDVSGPNTLANARLIAAAPELYDTIFRVAEQLVSIEGRTKGDRLRLKDQLAVLRAALAKARGDA